MPFTLDWRLVGRGLENQQILARDQRGNVLAINRVLTTGKPDTWWLSGADYGPASTHDSQDAAKAAAQHWVDTGARDRLRPAMTIRTSGVRQPSLWASVVSEDAGALHDWLIALGFTEDLMIPGERDGAIHHCQLDWPEGGRVMLSSTDERNTPCRPGTNSLHVVTSDPDAVMARAEALGAAVVHPLVDQTDYASRDFTVADPDGNHWTFATFAG